MKIYSDFALARSRQIVIDLVALVVLVLGVIAGVAVHDAIRTLAAVGRQVQKAGGDFESTLADAAKAVAGIPLVGDGVRKPFDAASGAGRTLAEAGANEQAAIGVLATVAGILVALVPLYFVVRYLLLRRIRFARDATAAARTARTPGGIDLLALRALVNADARDVLRLDESVVERWRSGDPVIVRELAALELRQAGLRAPVTTAG